MRVKTVNHFKEFFLATFGRLNQVFNMISWIYLSLFGLFCALLFFKFKTRSEFGGRSLPGPWGFPILGYMPFMALNPHKTLAKLGEKYGNIFQIKLGSYRVVVLNDYNAIKEAFREDVFCGRPNLKMLEVRNRGVKKGLVCSEGREWIEQRKFTMRHLRDLGFGKSSIECFVQEEIGELIANLRKNALDGSPVNLASMFNAAVLNTLWRITCGERYSHNDPILQDILKKTSADLSETHYTGPLLFLPWLIKLMPILTRWSEFTDSITTVHKFLKNKIEEHKDRSEGQPIDFIDHYLEEIWKSKDSKSSFYGKTGEHFLQVVLLDLFMAGGDTTSTTLYWAFLYLIIYPEIQLKIQLEIDRVIGKVPPSFQHRKLMPYTEATICEILRSSALVPLGLFHSTTDDISITFMKYLESYVNLEQFLEFHGFRIPKDTVIIANLYNVHHSGKFWDKPEEFNPERFTNSAPNQSFLPFSAGKRVCPGELMARDQIFLFVVSLLQQFNFTWDPASPKPGLEPKIGVVLSPKTYHVIPTIRN